MTAGSPTTAGLRSGIPAARQEEHGDRAAWPWLPGSIVKQCGADEWQVCVEDRDVAVLRDGRPAPRIQHGVPEPLLPDVLPGFQ